MAQDFETLRREIHDRLLGSLDFAAADKLDRAQLTRECATRVESLIDRSGVRLSAEQRKSLIQGVLDDMFGLGPLEPLLADAAVTDVLVVGHDKVFVERRGLLERSPTSFRNPAHLTHVIQRLVRNAGRRIDERSPMVDARLPDGSRVNAVIPPVAVDGPQLSIRRFPENPFTLDALVDNGTIADASRALLKAAVAGRMNLLVSGGTGAGKTTILNALSGHVGIHERIVTIEDAAELRLQGDHVVRLETRPANTEGVGAVSTRDLVRNALRMRPDRIIVGECCGAEALGMLQAMNTGHEGSMTTIHANSAREALSRLESMLSMGGIDVPLRVVRDYIADAVDLVVHVARLPDGRRVIEEIAEVTDSNPDGVVLRTIHVHELTAFRDGAATGRFSASGATPAFMPKLEVLGLAPPASTFKQGPLTSGGPR